MATKTPIAQEARYRFARRLSRVTASAVREILKVTERPEIISFAGGLPAPEMFPVEAIARAHAAVFAEEGREALQYSTTEGWLPLRQWIAARLLGKGIQADARRVLITSGSQQGIDLTAKAFLDPGDAVIVESPCYLAALQAFGEFEASFTAVGSDDHGIRVDEVEHALNQSRHKLIYIVPDFHNPKGTTLSRERRERLIHLSREHRVPILEDDPYGELRYEGRGPEPLAALDRDGLVIYLSTFSKTLSPGMRIGWVHASEQVFQALVVLKQAADLHTSTIAQRAAARLLDGSGGDEFQYDSHLERIRSVYGERCRAMRGSLEQHFPNTARWSRPEGGLFLWVELPAGVKGEDLLEDALAEQVAFVPGASFFACNPAHNFIRLNFSNCSPERIDEGIRRLARVLQRRMP